jgi:hypothetical protein
MPPLLLDVWEDWVCAAGCGQTARVRPLPPNGTRFHVCPRLHMLVAPLVRAGTDCKVVASAREDYLRGDIQRAGDDGRPYMNVTTTHGDGRTDVAVFAPVAQATVGS